MALFSAQKLQTFGKAGYGLLAFLFLIAAVVFIAGSWNLVTETFSTGNWSGRSYLLTLLFIACLAVSAWCLSLSGFKFQLVFDGLTLVTCAALLLVAFFLLLGKPAGNQQFLPFLIVLGILVFVHIKLLSLLNNSGWAIVLSLLFPAFGLAALLQLYIYAFASGCEWQLWSSESCAAAAQSNDVPVAKTSLNGWIVLAYLTLATASTLFTIPYKKALQKLGSV